MSSIIVEQALYGAFDGGGYRFVARSPGFREEWLAEAERLCVGFGERPAGVACPAAVFAQPLGRRHVAVVQAADQGTDDAGRPGALGFHLLVLGRNDYQAVGGDPFQLADRQPPPWQARGELPSLSWPAEPLPPRTVEQTRQVLKRADGPVLLGGSQVLVDGGRVVFMRQQPDPALLRDLWRLLPTRTRGQIWPASFAFGNSLRFHALAVPKAEGEEFTHYHTEEQAGDYPEGRYELALQIAAETGDQRELDRLFRRRSQADTLRLAWTILAASIVVLLLVGLFNPAQPVQRKQQSDPTAKKEPVTKAVPDLPPDDRYAPLKADELERLNRQLIELVQRTGDPLPSDLRRGLVVISLTMGPTFPQLATIGLLSEGAPLAFLHANRLIVALDKRLGTPDPGRIAEDMGDNVPVERRLRVLLWKHGVAIYNDPRLNVFELLERLEPVVATKKSAP
jgi:hypothetical protein